MKASPEDEETVDSGTHAAAEDAWIEGAIDGVAVAPLCAHRDDRGWLIELFRVDELEAERMPVMSYVSVTRPGVTRGPHEHVEQTDIFGFVGPGTFQLTLWDNRPASPTYRRRQTTKVGTDNPVRVAVPPGVVHGYTNVSEEPGWVLNFPNRLYAGRDKEEPVDEIRHEDSEDALFQM